MNKKTTPIIVGNWKTTPETLQEALTLIKGLDKKCAASKIKLPKKAFYIATPDIFVPHLTRVSKRGVIGAQTISGIASGQQTGLTIASQLKSGGANFVIIGHSEVRKRGEDVEDRAQKIFTSLAAKLPVVICFGEQHRDKDGDYLHELEQDVHESLVHVEKKQFENIIIAYEPVWAIGGKVPATPAECFEAVIALRRALASIGGMEYAKKLRILYGGAVQPDNAKTFLEEGGVDGLLIGRASQNTSSFFEIIKACYE